MKIVLAVGCWDLLHPGHIYHLEAASKMGRLFVGVTRDKHVNKGPWRPVFSHKERMHCLRALRCVAQTFLCDSSIQALKYLKPDVFALGKEYRWKVRAEDRAFCKANVIEIKFTKEKTYSSTALLHFYDRLRENQTA